MRAHPLSPLHVLLALLARAEELQPTQPLRQTRYHSRATAMMELSAHEQPLATPTRKERKNGDVDVAAVAGVTVPSAVHFARWQ